MEQIGHEHPALDAFDVFANRVRNSLAENLVSGGGNLFIVDTGTDLYDRYLESFEDPNQRQYHTCSCCRDFINRFGSLGVVGQFGDLGSALWDDVVGVPDLYREACMNMGLAVERGTIAGIFKTNQEVWGVPELGGFSHFSVTPPKKILLNSYQRPSEKMGELNENHRLLQEAMSLWNVPLLRQAVEILKTGSFSGQEKAIGGAEFLLGLHEKRSKHSPHRENQLWRAAAEAPTGWCHPRSGMIGTLLDDLSSGMALEDVKRRWNAKMHPLRYQRPQAAPNRQTIERAEKIVKDMGIERSLERRFARLEDLNLIWQPAAEEAHRSGIFGGVRAKDEDVSTPASMGSKPQNITWVRFARDVLPNARKIEVLTGRSFDHMNLGAFVTATHADAPPILQWDTQEDRRPLSMYVYHGGSDSVRWNLPHNTWVEATGIALHPAYWNPERTYDHFTKCACIVLRNCRDVGRADSLALFPSTLRSELHEVRAVIEAFSKQGRISGGEEASACGLWVGSSDWNRPIRVTTDTLTMVYNIDRWE